MQRKLLLFFFGFFYWTTIHAQRTVIGTVTDPQGEPVVGATVTMKGAAGGAITDTRGRFSLQMPEGVNTLVVRCTGYAVQEVTAEPGVPADIRLTQEGVQLPETVITALNIPREERTISAAVQTISGEQINAIRPLDLNAALAGKLAGVQVRGQSGIFLDGRFSTLRVRGEGAFFASGGPIYVIDGTVSSWLDVPMDDIESISLLKGPNATSLYGADGAGGVLMITTKKAKAGSSGIVFNQSTSADRVYVLPEYQNLYAGGAVANLIPFVWESYMPESWKVFEGKYYHDYANDASWGPRMEGQEYIPWYAWYEGTPYFGKTTQLKPQPDNVRDFYATGIIANTSLSFYHGARGISNTVTFAHNHRGGLLPNSDQNYFYLTLRPSFDLGKYFTLFANLNFNDVKSKGVYEDTYANHSSGNFNAWFHRHLDMNIIRELQGLTTPDGVLASWNHGNPQAYQKSPKHFYGASYWYNFYDFFKSRTAENGGRYFNGDINLVFRADKHFQVKGTYRRLQQHYYSERKFSNALENSTVNNLGGYLDYRSRYSLYSSTSLLEYTEVLISYNNRWQHFSVDANAGANFRRQRGESTSGSTNGGLVEPDIYAFDNSVNPPDFSVYKDPGKTDTRTIFIRGALGYRDLIYVDWSLRKDWFAYLVKGRNTYEYPSAGLSFIVSELLPRDRVISYAKLRFNWGRVGNLVAVNDIPLYTTLGRGIFNGKEVSTIADVQVEPSLKPSVTNSAEGGFDLKLFKNRFGAALTFYRQVKTNETLTVPVSGASGYTAKRINTGKIVRSGLEFTFNATPLQSRQFQWMIALNGAPKAKNQIEELAPGIEALTIGFSSFSNSAGVTLVQKEGESWGQLRGGGIQTLDGQPVVDENGLYVREPNKNFGSVIPDFTGGMQNNLRYGPFEFYCNIDFQSGGKYFSLTELWGNYSGIFASTAAVNDRGKNVRDPVSDGGGVRVTGVLADGTPVDRYVEAYPYFHQFRNRGIAEPYIHSLSFVKLREISLRYTLPLKKWGWKRVHELSVAAVAQNPWLIYAGYRDFDPSEIAFAYGENGQFPSMRSFGFNLRFKL
ncbi:MAG: SusC/RagA family TonB-linked outer membrane protein [Thermoanaerobaculia bacterium]|nr:SusC/RagA family TonB-linked outer membrane protein [Thermoanaerobaculia bacterium]